MLASDQFVDTIPGALVSNMLNMRQLSAATIENGREICHDLTEVKHILTIRRLNGLRANCWRTNPK